MTIAVAAQTIEVTHHDVSCQEAPVVDDAAVQVELTCQLKEELRQQASQIREMELQHAEKIRAIRDHLRQETATSQSTHARYVTVKAQANQLERLLQIANEKIEELQSRLEAANTASGPTEALRRNFVETHSEKLKVEEEFENLKREYLLATQNLQMAMQELGDAKDQVEELQHAYRHCQKKFEEEKGELIPISQYQRLLDSFNKLEIAYTKLESDSQEQIVDLEIGLREAGERVDEARSTVTLFDFRC